MDSELTEEIEKALLTLDTVFKKHNITYWLEAGTLVGMCREKRILPWDSDADVSYPIELGPKISLLVNEFKKLGYDLVGNLGFGLCKNGVHLVCIFASKKVDDFVGKCYFKQHPLHPYIKSYHEMITNPILTWFMSKFVLEFRMMRAKWETLYPLSYIEFKGHLLPIPHNYDEYLTYRFGDWRTPLKYDGSPERRTGVQYEKWKNAIVFPCKCDPINIGHIIQIKKLYDKYGGVIIDLYDYPDRLMSVKEVGGAIKLIFPANVTVKTYTKPYSEEIPKEKNRKYAVVSPKVAEILKKHKIKVIKLDRIPGYHSKDMKKMYNDFKKTAVSSDVSDEFMNTEEKKKNIVVFPCKCDPIHMGHIMQIEKMITEYGNVIVDIYDYPGRLMSIEEVRNILKIINPKKVTVKTYTKPYTDEVPSDKNKIYATANDEVAEILLKNGIKVIKLDKIPGYCSKEMRNMYKKDIKSKNNY